MRRKEQKESGRVVLRLKTPLSEEDVVTMLLDSAKTRV
jgi:hypothetical protein